MNDIKKRWINFFQVLLDPWSVLLILGTIGLSIILLNQNDTVIITILTFIITISAGILGGILGKRWENLTEEKIIVARGKSAVRDLKLLLGNIALLEDRALCFRKWTESEKQKDTYNHEVTAVNLDEIIGRCNIIEEETINSIENWTDVVPEANVSSQIGIITSLKHNVESLSIAVASVTKELDDSKNKSAAEKKILQTEKRQKEKELEEARKELLDRSLDYRITPTSSSADSSLINLYSSSSSLSGTSSYTLDPGYIRGFNHTRLCINCGKAFSESPSLSPSAESSLCLDCRSKPTNLTKNKINK